MSKSAISDNYSVDEVPAVRELIVAAAVEARRLADEVDASVRKRLLVLAHTTQLLARELEAGETSAADGRREAEAVQFATAIRAGHHDHELGAMLARVRSEVRARVEVSAPGYAD
jgi:hypothetical protein